MEQHTRAAGKTLPESEVYMDYITRRNDLQARLAVVNVNYNNM